jgi:hypothetical protein
MRQAALTAKLFLYVRCDSALCAFFETVLGASMCMCSCSKDIMLVAMWRKCPAVVCDTVVFPAVLISLSWGLLMMTTGLQSGTIMVEWTAWGMISDVCFDLQYSLCSVCRAHVSGRRAWKAYVELPNPAKFCHGSACTYISLVGCVTCASAHAPIPAAASLKLAVALCEGKAACPVVAVIAALLIGVNTLLTCCWGLARADGAQLHLCSCDFHSTSCWSTVHTSAVSRS